jgi:tRNA threonylcarbamoyladenosine dehydratase
LENTLGKPKVQVLTDRMRLISPECILQPLAAFFTETTAPKLLETNFDFVIDAVDRMSIKSLIIATCRQRKLPVLTVGAAGGRWDATAVRVTDLADASHDSLLRQTRRKLRRDYGFPAAPQGSWNIPSVFSTESVHYPWSDGCIHDQKEAGSTLKLDCGTGFGAATYVTGTFGFVAAGEVVRRLALMI